jgi:hypothetical protein
MSPSILTVCRQTLLVQNARRGEPYTAGSAGDERHGA